MTRTPVTIRDLSAFADLANVQLSHDGQFAAVTRSVPCTEANRYRVTVAIGGVGDPLAELASAADETLPRWSPVDDRLATVAAGRSIVVRTLAGPEPVPLVRDWPDRIEELAWSPDGAWLLYVAREPVDRTWWETSEDRRPPLRITRLRARADDVGWTFNRPRQAYLVSARTGAVTKLSAGGHDDAEFGWYPDSRAVVFVSAREPAGEGSPANEVYRQGIAAGSAAEALTGPGYCYGQPRVSPDGSRVAFTRMDVANFPSVTALCVAEFGDWRERDLSASLDRDVNPDWRATDGPVWLDDTTVLALVEDAGRTEAYRFDTAGAVPVLERGPRSVTSLAAKAGTLAYVTCAPAQPPQLVARVAAGPETVLWQPNSTVDRELREPVPRSVPLAAGHQVDSWLTLPDADRWQAPYPLVVCMQGGGTQHGYQWSHEFQTLAAAGFATLTLNPRGCAGYGTAWMHAVSGPEARQPGTGWGVDDINDIAEVVRHTLGSHDDLDPARVGVMGGSYGGLVVTWLLARSGLFRAGWAERGPYNLVSLAGTNDESPWFFETYLGRAVTEDPAAYWASSALRVAADIDAPLMIVHSEEDRRCPIQQAEELYLTLKVLGKPVEFARFPGESHELTRSGSPVHRVQRLELLHEWFSTHLGPRARTETGVR
ncbi:S9 family peptidase [Amycolatopsis jejuensis]|uniref:S9 family peptidase n=1 Tax=Amycolatopsis jejuensis TaxID=330084 RepID=UPI0005241A0F|nr:S9 family peptidase [Amycolatopsis jejuensis]